jgi:hypothetical protein
VNVKQKLEPLSPFQRINKIKEEKRFMVVS